MSDKVIETTGLTVYYGKQRGIKDVNLTVEQGEAFGFLGPNGAGKTTTQRVLLDVIRPTAGRAAIFGLDSQAQGVQLRRRVGYLPGELALYKDMRIDRFFEMYEFLRGANGAKGYWRELAGRLDLDVGRKIAKLSRGNKQKVGVVAAFMNRPDLLILDEPTGGLDPLVQQTVMEMVREVKADGRTVFFSSHILPEVQAVCDRVGIIRQGELIATQGIEELIAARLNRLTMVFDDIPPAATFMGVSRTGPASSQSYTPKALPSPPEITAVEATGQNGTVKITFNAFNSRDGQASTIAVSPGTFSTSVPAGGASGVTGTVTGLTNGQAYNLTLAARTTMGTANSSPSASVTPYGPIPAPTVSIRKTVPTTSAWSVSASGNGRPITVQIRLDSGQNNQDQSTTMQGSWTGTSDVGWAPASESISVSIVDSAGRPTPSGSAGPVASDRKANPIVIVSHGAIGCGSYPTRYCTYLTLSGFNSSSAVHCQVGGVTLNGWEANWTVGPDGNRGADTWGVVLGTNTPSPLYDLTGSAISDGAHTDICTQR